MSRGPSASFKPSSAACVPAFACTRPTSPIRRTSPCAFSTLTASRAARTAAAGWVMLALPRVRRSAVQSTTSRTDRLIHVAIWLLMRPVLRAALTTVSPTRAGTAAPAVA